MIKLTNYAFLVRVTRSCPYAMKLETHSQSSSLWLNRLLLCFIIGKRDNTNAELLITIIMYIEEKPSNNKEPCTQTDQSLLLICLDGL